MNVETKIALVNEMLSDGKISLHVKPHDPTKTLDLPQSILEMAAPNSFIVLDLGLNMPVPIPDLAITNTGISATLSFNRRPYHCFIPWEAVFCVVGEEFHIMWPKNLPPTSPTASKDIESKKTPSYLKLVE